jgi:transposase, IS5 family
MNKANYKPQGFQGLFDQAQALDFLSASGNPLKRLSSAVDFEIFRSTLEEHVLNQNKKNNAGARPYDPVLMFKILILQRMYNLSDQQTQYQIVDRASFKEFLGLASGDKVPDEKTIWNFRETLVNNGLDKKLFDLFHNFLVEKDLILNEGKIVDASFMPAPKQHNKPDENKTIKEGHGEELWKDQPHKKAQKDIDARWAQKGGENHYGYKIHVKVDAKSKLVDKQVCTPASVHDSQVLDELLDEEDQGQDLYADSGYVGKQDEEAIESHKMGNQVCERAYRNKPLNEEQKKTNREKSHIRCRVEHVLGVMEQSMHKLAIRSIGLLRAKFASGFTALLYNMTRYEQIVRLGMN